MPLASSEVHRMLVGKLGMRVAEGRHRKYKLYVEGSFIAQTMMSQGGRQDLSDNLVTQMARQIGVDRTFFEDLVSCSESRDSYLARLGQRDRRS